MRKKQNSNPITTVKLSISAPPRAKPLLTKTQRDTLASLGSHDIAAVAEDTNLIN